MIPEQRPAPNDFQRKRVQRMLEYAVVVAVQLFFALSFRAFFEWWMAGALAVVMFCMNFQLTQLRERRRTMHPRDRRRVIADTFESILLLLFVVLLSMGGSAKRWLGMQDQEFLGYVAAMLAGIFLAALIGEVFWQRRHYASLDDEPRANYVRNLRRTIIFPYVK